MRVRHQHPGVGGHLPRHRPATPGEQPRFDRLTTGHRIDEGELVALAGGVLWTGYEGSIGRTRPCHGPRGGSVPAAQRALYHAVVRGDEPGAGKLPAGRDRRRPSGRVHIEPANRLPCGRSPTSIGIGSEGPIAGSALGAEFDATQRIDTDMVLTVQAHVADESGGFFGLDTVLVTADGPEVLTTLSHGPLAAGE